MPVIAYPFWITPLLSARASRDTRSEYGILFAGIWLAIQPYRCLLRIPYRNGSAGISKTG